MARSIHKAKESKNALIEYIKAGPWKEIPHEIKIVIHENDLALKMIFQKNTNTNWNKEYNGFPLLVEEPVKAT